MLLYAGIFYKRPVIIGVSGGIAMMNALIFNISAIVSYECARLAKLWFLSLL